MQLLLENRQAPGDLLVMTSAVRALHATRPGEYSTCIASTQPAVWQNNPHVGPMVAALGGKHYKLGYTPGISSSNRTCGHFSHAFTVELASKLGFDLKLADMRPHVVLAPDEGPVCGLEPYAYWVVMAGGKSDFTAKLWGYSRWQAVIDALPGIKWVQAGATSPRSIQKPLKNVENLLGKTNFREFLRLVAFSRGVICPVTSGMHAAAAFNRPCVVVGGGREPWWWEAYNKATWTANCGTEPPADFVPHAFLHTMGQLPCCRHHGCWKAGIGEKPHKNCVDVVRDVECIPRCMQLIEPDLVVQAVKDYEIGKYPAEMAMPEWLEPPISRYAPAGRSVRAGIAVKQAKIRPVHIQIPQKAYEPAAEGRQEVRPAPIMRFADVMRTHTLRSLDPVHVIVEPMVGFADGQRSVLMAVTRYTPAKVAQAPSTTGWTVWLAPGVRPTAPGWLYLVGQAARRGAAVVAGASSGWLAACPQAAAGLNGANWRTLLNKATRVRCVRMTTEQPGVIV